MQTTSKKIINELRDKDAPKQRTHKFGLSSKSAKWYNPNKKPLPDIVVREDWFIDIVRNAPAVVNKLQKEYAEGDFYEFPVDSIDHGIQLYKEVVQNRFKVNPHTKNLRMNYLEDAGDLSIVFQIKTIRRDIK